MSIIIAIGVFVLTAFGSINLDALTNTMYMNTGIGDIYALAFINATLAGGIYQIIQEIRKINNKEE